MASVVSSLRKEVAEGGKVQNVDVGLVSDVGAELTRATVDRIRKPTVEIAPDRRQMRRVGTRMATWELRGGDVAISPTSDVWTRTRGARGR
ncbi:hypothetical protein OPV22_018860 [Ensete ventricosum]|uniref:SMP domain-containing protein n=1 Tax=Ensete ventricosum TaxID=4639 RepID=A0AAV8R2X5_ENSVE|nr:hypothetical protein OPV22_018860 [Ensete ventricosum]